MSESIDIVELNKLLFQFKWFVCVEEQHNKFVVTVDEINTLTNSLVPQTFAGKQVLLQNKTFKFLDKSQYVTSINMESVVDEDALQSLKWLQERFSVDFLEDLAYEVHDGDDAVTSLNESFPKEYDIMMDIYPKLGLDLILNKLK